MNKKDTKKVIGSKELDDNKNREKGKLWETICFNYIFIRNIFETGRIHFLHKF